MTKQQRLQVLKELHRKKIEREQREFLKVSGLPNHVVLGDLKDLYITQTPEV